jgi:hypothetical protein
MSGHYNLKCTFDAAREEWAKTFKLTFVALIKAIRSCKVGRWAYSHSNSRHLRMSAR